MGEWRKCSSCRNPIALGAKYFNCSVSTCNSKRMGLFFCSVSCWEAHLPSMRHREAWAVEATAPRTALAPQETPSAPTPAREQASTPTRKAVAAPVSKRSAANVPTEVLIIASRLKAFVRASSGMNTSDSVLGPISDHVRRLMHQAVDNAEQDGRKTLLERDFTFLRRLGAG